MGKKSAAVMIFLVTLAAVEGVFYFQLSIQHEQLKKRYVDSELNYSMLLENYTSLRISYDELRSNFSMLQNSYLTLNESYVGLAESYSNLKEVYEHIKAYQEELNKTYYTLLENYSAIEGEYSKLQAGLEELNEKYLKYVEAYHRLAFQVNLHIFHPSGNESLFITPDDPAVKEKVTEITGGWSDKEDWDEFWIDVKRMYSWVVTHIAYREDGFYPFLPEEPNQNLMQLKEMWQFPNQTLQIGKGDCEDMAVLLASMIYSYVEKEYWVEVIVITNHIAVYIPVKNDRICILDPAGKYYTNTGFPRREITAKDVREEIYNWLDFWSDRIENPEVKWVFSAYLWENFIKTGKSGTENFISWMYSREEI